MQLIENATEEKLRGGFYTPAPIADFIIRWGINGSQKADILEPSCGDGVFLEQLKNNNIPFNSLTAVEFDSIESEKADNINLPGATVINSDFHLYCNETLQRFDLVIGNPPYIRYQYFDEDQQKEAEKIFKRAGLKYSKLTDSWVSFIVGATLLLKEKGKIGFVIPAELLQVSYAKQLREFLAKEFNKINIISFEKLVFEGIQQEVILLLCEKNNSDKHFIEHIEIKDAKGLLSLDINRLKSSEKTIDFHSNKWTYYFLEQEEIDFLTEVANNFKIPLIGDFAEVEVGITTGSNEYFTVPLSTVKKYHLESYSRPLVGRSVQVNGNIFSKEDWLKNRKEDVRAHLLVFPEKKKLANNTGALSYLEKGRLEGIHKGYKTGIRDEWQIVPSIWVPDVLFIRRNNVFPRLVLNTAKAYTTDTMHRVKVKKGVNTEAFIASFYNSLSFAFAEISGRSYGGGVLELMPSEVEKIVLPYRVANKKLLTKIDSMLRKNRDINEILKYTNEVILKEGFGLNNKQIALSNSIWHKLSSRRLNRSNNL